jgi:hypothetical protein
MKQLLIFGWIMLAAALLAGDAFAQCAMCKATIEANQTNAGKYGVGLNTGILYLMSIPYIAAMVIGYFWYRNARRSGKIRGFRNIRSQGIE